MPPESTPWFPVFRKVLPRICRVASGFCQAGVSLLRRLVLSRAFLRVCLFGTTAVVALYVSLRWKGRREWEAEHRRALVLGMDMELAPELPYQAGDPDNFFEAPVFKDLYKGTAWDPPGLSMWFGKSPDGNLAASPGAPTATKKGAMPALEEWCSYFRKRGTLPSPPRFATPEEELAGDPRWQATIAGIHAAASRPWAALKASEESPGGGKPIVLGRMHGSLMLHARALLRQGQPAEALPAFRVTRHLVQAWAQHRQHQGLNLVRMRSLLSRELPLLKEGMARHVWPQSLLEQLLADDYPDLFHKQGAAAIREERARVCSRWLNFSEAFLTPEILAENPLEHLRKHLVPEYFPTHAATVLSRSYVQQFQASRAMQDGVTWAAILGSIQPSPPAFGPRFLLTESGETWPADRKRFAGSYVLPVIHAAVRHLAVAAELYYVKQGRYPEDLARLQEKIRLPWLATQDISGTIRYTCSNPEGPFSLEADASPDFGGTIHFSSRD